MHNKFLRHRISIATLIGALTLTFSTVGLASDFNNHNVENSYLSTKAISPIESVQSHHGKHKDIDKVLKGLVDKNVITEKQSKEVKSYLEEAHKGRKEEMKKIKKMTKEERKEHFKKYKEEKNGVFDKMIKDGVISEEQAKEIKKAIRQGKKR